jgi:hypothetical protein
MRACPPNRTCSRHHDGGRTTTDIPGQHSRKAASRRKRPVSHGRSEQGKRSRRPPIGGTSGEASSTFGGSPRPMCHLTDRDPDQAAHRTRTSSTSSPRAARVTRISPVTP